jgi:F0F1-type ATP synthase assembly protein I
MTEQDDTPRDGATGAGERAEPGTTGEGRQRGPALTPSVAQYAIAGMQFAAGVLLFLYAGQWLDRRLGTTPWLVIVGAFLGAAAGFLALYRKLNNDRKRVAAGRLHNPPHR